LILIDLLGCSYSGDSEIKRGTLLGIRAVIFLRIASCCIYTMKIYNFYREGNNILLFIYFHVDLYSYFLYLTVNFDQILV
jgi:hypothetical protein